MMELSQKLKELLEAGNQPNYITVSPEVYHKYKELLDTNSGYRYCLPDDPAIPTELTYKGIPITTSETIQQNQIYYQQQMNQTIHQQNLVWAESLNKPSAFLNKLGGEQALLNNIAYMKGQQYFDTTTGQQWIDPLNGKWPSGASTNWTSKDLDTPPSAAPTWENKLEEDDMYE